MNHVTDRLQAYLDGELTIEARRRIEAHLQRCAECRREAAAVRSVWQTVDALAEPRLERSVWPGVAARTAGRPRTLRPPAPLAAAALAAGLAIGLGIGGLLPHQAGGSSTAVVAVGADADRDELFTDVTPLDQIWWSVGDPEPEAGS